MSGSRSINLEAGLNSHSSPSSATTPSRPNGGVSGVLGSNLPGFLNFQRHSPSVPHPNQQAPSGVNAKIYRHNVERYPEGWARLAAEQDESVNIAIHRKFSYLGNRCLLYYEQKITRMEDQLLELDWQIANGEGVQGQPNQPPVQSHEEPDPRNQKIEAIFENLARYQQALLNEKAIAALYEVGDAEHKLRYDKVRNDGYLGQDEMKYLCYVNDFISTRPDKLRLAFESLFYKSPDSSFTNMLQDRSARKEKNAKSLYYAAVVFLFRAVLIWFCAILLLLPVALLGFLPDLSIQTAAGIVLAFSGLVAIVLVWLENIQTETILLGLSAYLAVLVAFLTSKAST